MSFHYHLEFVKKRLNVYLIKSCFQICHSVPIQFKVILVVLNTISCFFFKKKKRLKLMESKERLYISRAYCLSLVQTFSSVNRIFGESIT